MLWERGRIYKYKKTFDKQADYNGVLMRSITFLF